MYTLAVAMHAQTHIVRFDDKAAAEAELAKIKPLIGQERWGKNGEASPTHTITAPDGDVVVVLDKVELVSLVDEETGFAKLDALNDKRDAVEIERKLRYRRALQAAGFDQKP